jgi:choline transporter-like protein 2/4/5
MFWFNLFGMFWVLSWLEAYNLFVLVSSACIWYFEVGDETTVTKPRKVINRSFFRGIRFHMGSLAFGSLIVAIIRMAIVILEYIKFQMETSGGTVTKSDIYKCLLTCCQACLVCCLKCVEFLNKHAYIQVI